MQTRQASAPHASAITSASNSSQTPASASAENGAPIFISLSASATQPLGIRVCDSNVLGGKKIVVADVLEGSQADVNGVERGMVVMTFNGLSVMQDTATTLRWRIARAYTASATLPITLTLAHGCQSVEEYELLLKQIRASQRLQACTRGWLGRVSAARIRTAADAVAFERYKAFKGQTIAAFYPELQQSSPWGPNTSISAGSHPQEYRIAESKATEQYACMDPSSYEYPEADEETRADPLLQRDKMDMRSAHEHVSSNLMASKYLRGELIRWTVRSTRRTHRALVTPSSSVSAARNGTNGEIRSPAVPGSSADLVRRATGLTSGDATPSYTGQENLIFDVKQEADGETHDTNGRSAGRLHWARAYKLLHVKRGGKSSFQHAALMLMEEQLVNSSRFRALVLELENTHSHSPTVMEPGTAAAGSGAVEGEKLGELFSTPPRSMLNFPTPPTSKARGDVHTAKDLQRGDTLEFTGALNMEDRSRAKGRVQLKRRQQEAETQNAAQGHHDDDDLHATRGSDFQSLKSSDSLPDAVGEEVSWWWSVGSTVSANLSLLGSMLGGIGKSPQQPLNKVDDEPLPHEAEDYPVEYLMPSKSSLPDGLPRLRRALRGSAEQTDEGSSSNGSPDVRMGALISQQRWVLGVEKSTTPGGGALPTPDSAHLNQVSSSESWPPPPPPTRRLELGSIRGSIALTRI